ncbi:E3 ubiquitin-protein ligase rnf213-alpha-like [Symsagittifera roscoffensis]|uniref:E3 ubiquitin-protein ligase rnf213-alpha-like n=1 Tax=Symsagittifera roscoffensis TaxID=84072 RepID=UPI00307B9A42
MKLFNVKELCRLRPQNPNEVKFDSCFPFSTEIIDKLNSMWIDSLENYADSELEDWQFFVERFNNQGRELGNELTEISSEEDAVDSFVHDLILNEFWSMWNNKYVQAEHVKMIKKALKSIMKTNLPEFENPTIAFAFAHFKKLLPCLYNISTVLKFFGSFKIGDPETPEQFVCMITQTALEQTKTMAEKMKPANIDLQTIQELDQQVSVLKMCSGIELDDDKFKLKKLTMLSTYMSQISHNLDDATAKMARTASDTLYKAVSSKTADESIFGTDLFRNRLLMCLNRSADTVIQYCVETETGQRDCAFCRKPVTAKGAIPFSLPCTGGHAVHESCLTERMERITQGEAVVTCGFCQHSLESRFLQANTMFACQTEPQKSNWKQFWLNISNAFLGIVKENVIAICDEDTLKKYLEICVVPKSRTSKKDTPWITDQTRQSLLTFIATSEKSENLDEILMAIINQDKETGANEIDLARTYDMLLSVFDFVYLNESLQATNDSIREEMSSVNQIRLVAKVKIELSEFIIKSVVPNADKGPQGLTDSVPRLVTEFLNNAGESAECVKRYFIQCLCRDHRMDLYQRVKTFPQLAPLIPEILFTSQSQGFSDIFLIFGDAYQMPFSEVYTSLVTDANKGLRRLSQVTDAQMKNIVAYRLIAEIRSKENPPESFAQFEEAIMTNRVIHGLSRSVIDRNDRLTPNVDALRQFLFYYQTLLEVQENYGFLQPFKDIFNVRGRADGLYLPTFPDSASRRVRMMGQAIGQGPEDQRTTWNQCPNGHLYLIGNCGQATTGGTCPDCRATIGGLSHALHAGNRLVGNRDANINVANGQVVTGYVDNHNLNVFDRAFLNEFNGNVMQFFVHASLYICNGDEVMLTRLRTNVEKIARTSLNRSEEDVLKFLLTVVIVSTKSSIQGSFASEEQREAWESSFINIINNTLQNLPDVIATYDEAFKNDSRNESNNLLDVLSERTDRDTRDNVLANGTFWRRLPKVSLACVRNELNANGEKYKLLDCIFKNKEWLPKLRHIPDLFEFFSNIVSYYDPDTSDSVVTLEDFLHQRKIQEPVRKRMKDVSIIFCKLWNLEVRHLPTTGGIDCLYKDKLKPDSPLKFFLPSRHVSDCCALVTLNILVSKNNEFIEAYRSALHIETPAMEFSNGVVKGEHVALVSNVDRELLSSIANFATTDARAKRVHYDLSGIEGTIGHHLFKFKPLISMKVMKLMTKSSSTKDALNNARHCILDETKLTRSEAKKIQNKYTDMPEVCKMLRQLILLMKYMEKDRKVDPKQTIGEFLKNIKIEAMPGISDIKLESCVFLWQALALQRTRLMLEHQDEEPYAGIQHQFRETLTSQQEKELDKLPATKKYVLLTYLNELIVLNLDEPDLMNPNYHIVDDALAPVYFDVDLNNLNLPEWCQFKYAEGIIKHLIQTEN